MSDLTEFSVGDAAIYRKAAEIFERGGFCRIPDCGWSCCALSAAIDMDNHFTYHRLHRRIINEFGKEPWFGGPKTPENQKARKEALLWMASKAECLTEYVP